MTHAQMLAQDGEQDKGVLYSFLDRACETGDPLACYEYGMILAEAPNQTEEQEKKVARFYQLGCDADFGRSCYNLAWRYFDGKGVKKDRDEGLKITEKACKLGDSSACDYRATELVKEPESDEFEVSREYCENWGGRSCYMAAVNIAKKRGENADTAQKLIYFAQKACNRGDVAGCNVLGHVAKDHLRLCDAKEHVADSCTFAGFVYAKGITIPRLNGPSFDQDLEKAAQYFKMACNAGSKPACDEVSRERQ